MSQNLPFTTLGRPVEIAGIGLHSGAPVRARLCPRETPGWVFARTDLPGVPEVAARFQNISTTTHATTLAQNGVQISTTEHLLAALWALDISNCRIELNGPEVPILDGSALPWCDLISQAGREILTGNRPVFRLESPVWVEDERAQVLGVPCDEFRVSVAVDFGHPHAGPQTFDSLITPESFTRDIAPARTFTLENWLEPLKNASLIRGGSLENAVLIGENGPSSPWRLENEIARHKLLDVIGDLALLCGDGGIFRGHVTAIRGGHRAHRKWMHKVRHPRGRPQSSISDCGNKP